MVSAAIARGTGAAGSTSKAFSFYVDGLDLVDQLDWRSISIEMSAEASDNSRARFTLVNDDGSLDVTDYWASAWTFTFQGPYAYPLREVLLYDHARQEPLFGGYVTGLRTRIMYPNRTVISLECVGYSWLLDATFIPTDMTFTGAPDIVPTILAVVGAAGLRGGIRAGGSDIGLWTVDPDDPGVGVNGSIVTDPFTISARTSLRQAIIACADASNVAVGVFVDNFKRLCVMADDQGDVTARPLATFGTSAGTEEMEQVYDFSEYKSNVYLDSSTPEGAGWYGARLASSNDYSGTQPQDTINYQPVAIDTYTSNDDSQSNFGLLLNAHPFLAATQAGNEASYRLRKTGLFGWRLGHAVDVNYPQLNGGTAHQLVVTGYTLTFERPDQPVFDLTAQTTGRWGVGGLGGGFASAVKDTTSAQYTKRRVQLRSS